MKAWLAIAAAALALTGCVLPPPGYGHGGHGDYGRPGGHPHGGPGAGGHHGGPGGHGGHGHR